MITESDLIDGLNEIKGDLPFQVGKLMDLLNKEDYNEALCHLGLLNVYITSAMLSTEFLKITKS